MVTWSVCDYIYNIPSELRLGTGICSVVMEEISSAMEQQMDLMADLVQKLSGELRTGLQPAYANFIGFFHAIDWKVTESVWSEEF